MPPLSAVQRSLLALMPALGVRLYTVGEGLWLSAVVIVSSTLLLSIAQNVQDKRKRGAINISTGLFYAVLLLLLVPLNLPWPLLLSAQLAALACTYAYGGYQHAVLHPTMLVLAILSLGEVPIEQVQPLAYLLSCCYLLAGVYLCQQGVIAWQTPLIFVIASLLCAIWRDGLAVGAIGQWPLLQPQYGLLGWVVLGDCYRTPCTTLGRCIVAVGAAVLLHYPWPHRLWLYHAAMVLLLFNAATPLIEQWTRPKYLGYTR